MLPCVSCAVQWDSNYCLAMHEHNVVCVCCVRITNSFFLNHGTLWYQKNELMSLLLLAGETRTRFVMRYTPAGCMRRSIALWIPKPSVIGRNARHRVVRRPVNLLTVAFVCDVIY